MKHKFKMLMGGFVLMFGISLTSIYAHSEASVENHFSTGIVDIALQEYTLDEEGRETAWKDMKNVLPGEQISKIPRITNYGNDSYVRVRVNFENNLLSMNDVYGMSPDWLKGEDGYYYYKNSLTAGESIDLFQGIKIPDNFDQSLAETEFRIDVYLEAIQSTNFTPNYTESMPWGDVDILRSEQEGNDSVSIMKAAKAKKFSIEFEGEAQELFVNDSDFFSNFPTLLPGDVYMDSVKFINNSHQTIDLYFRTSEIQTEDSCDILEKMSLTITKCSGEQSEIIYDGMLCAKELNQGLLLCQLNAGEDGVMRYEIKIPEALNNVYSLKNEEVIWVFSTNPITDAPVPTGDSNSYLLVAAKLILAISLAALCIFILNFRRGEQRND